VTLCAAFAAVVLTFQDPFSFKDPPRPPSVSPTPRPQLVDGTTGAEVELKAVIDELRRRDVVVLGEDHDNTPGHRFFAEVIAALHRVRPDMVISMEQFERDTQGVVDDYLKGRIGEAEFLKHSRPWKNYAADYKPQIELAKQFKLDVIASNIPRPVASKYVSSENPIAAFKPSMVSAPQDRYWDLFKETMKEHPGSNGDPALVGMYRAQCAKDDAMAESIAEYLGSRPHRKPLVIHRCGKFHCDYGLGTVSRLLQRSPLLQVSIVSMASAPDLTKPDLTKHLKKAHYLVVVPEMPKKPEPKPDAKPAQKTPPKEEPSPHKTVSPHKAPSSPAQSTTAPPKVSLTPKS
jgi:uncharacterized iron-regulated protein